MRKLIFTALVAVLLGGCASPQVKAVNEYAKSNLPLAKSGEIKWSDYYKGVYDRLLSVESRPGRAENLEAANLLIDGALMYENGQITKDQFESFQRAAIADIEKKKQQADAIANAELGITLGNALTAYGREAYKPIPYMPLPHQMQCTSQNVGGGIVRTNCQ